MITSSSSTAAFLDVRGTLASVFLDTTSFFSIAAFANEFYGFFASSTFFLGGSLDFDLSLPAAPSPASAH